MRRMNYDRFAKPVNFGEFDNANNKFVLDKPLEDGIYFFKIIVSEDTEYIYCGSIEIKNGEPSCFSTPFLNYDNDEITCLSYWGNELKYHLEKVTTSNVIYLYKLD